MVHRFRSALLAENLSLIVLSIIRDSERSEWEILNIIYARYELAPGAKEFGKLMRTLIARGYASAECAEGIRKLKISSAGIELLGRLEREYFAIVSAVDARRLA